MRASTVVGTLAAAGAAAGVVRLVDRQFGPPREAGAVGNAWLRDVNKRVVNPLMVRAADLNLPYPAVVGHVGRSSGHAYQTPVVAARTPTGFVIPLPYGRDVDWVKNLLTAGGGTIRKSGETVGVVNPAVVGPAQALADVDGFHRAVWSRLGIADFLRLRLDRAAGPGG